MFFLIEISLDLLEIRHTVALKYLFCQCLRNLPTGNAWDIYIFFKGATLIVLQGGRIFPLLLRTFLD